MGTAAYLPDREGEDAQTHGRVEDGRPHRRSTKGESCRTCSCQQQLCRRSEAAYYSTIARHAMLRCALVHGHAQLHWREQRTCQGDPHAGVGPCRDGVCLTDRHSCSGDLQGENAGRDQGTRRKGQGVSGDG